MPQKTWVQIYRDVEFIKENHCRLFPTEIINRLDISYLRLKKIADELGIELLNISTSDNLMKRQRAETRLPKKKYKKRNKINWMVRFLKLFQKTKNK